MISEIGRRILGIRSDLGDPDAPVPGEGRHGRRRIDVKDADVTHSARLRVSAFVQNVVAEGHEQPGRALRLLDAGAVRPRDLVTIETALDVALALSGSDATLDFSGTELLAIDRERGVPGKAFHRPVLRAHLLP